MTLYKQLKDYYIFHGGDRPDAILAQYTKNLDDAAKGLLNANTGMLRANCDAPGVSPNRKLDILSRNNKDYRLLKVLLQEYRKGIEEIFNVYEDYYVLCDNQDFWKFFNKRLKLPTNWQEIE